MRTLKRWLTEPVESTLMQVPRALIASILAMGLDVGVLAFLVKLDWNPIVAAVVGYMAGVVLQYVLCTIWVFPGASETPTSFVAFTVLSLVGLGITAGLIHLASALGFGVFAGKFVALGVAFTWNFLSRKWLLFRATRSQYDMQLPLDVSPSVEMYSSH